MIWIPSHVNNPGNELADTAAKNAIQTTATSSQAEVSPYDYKKHLKQKNLEFWNNKWKEIPLTKLSQIRADIFTGQPVLPKKRRDQTVISRIRIGHTNVTHKHYMS